MGSRRTEIPGQENTYADAARWVDCALRSDDSLFTPGTPIWTLQGLGEIHERFLDRPDVSGDSFYVKTERQLAGSPPEVYQLMGELLHVHFLIVWEGAMSQATKTERINRVLRMSPSPLAMPALGPTPGIAHPGTAFNTFRPFQVGFIVEFVEQWKELAESERDRLLADPWEFKRFIESGIWGTASYHTSFIPNSALMQTPNHQAAARPQCAALLHLIFPDAFEGIVSANHKRRIAAWGARAFGIERTGDVDRDLQNIRPLMESKYRNDITYYERDILPLWNSPSPPPSSLQALADEIFLPGDFLEKIDGLLAEKNQIIFHGPPGTGKTYVAKELAKHLADEDEDRVTLVQFHPSYAYEDFIQGYRPTTLDSGQLIYKLMDGPLLLAAKRAEEEPDANHYLIIDEINRGNLGKVFGECYFLLEYRSDEILLQYSDRPFSLPPNLYVIGTMNTADRSIALVDLALRRRFYFVEFHPDKEPVEGLLLRFLKGNGLSDMEWVASFVDEANKKLADHDAAIGPSYFMDTDLDEAMAERVWEHAVRPYIEERLQGGDESTRNRRLKEFDALWAELSGDEDEEESPPSSAATAADQNGNA